MSNSNRASEIGTGLFVLLGFAALAFLTTQLPGSGLQLRRAAASIHLTARFDNVGDLKVGAPVTMAGVRIGRVDAVSFDPAEFKAVVALSIERRYNQIPDDSDAAIQTSGLLGAKYIGIGPGGGTTYLAEGVGLATTRTVVSSAILTLLLDYILTAAFLGS